MARSKKTDDTGEETSSDPLDALVKASSGKTFKARWGTDAFWDKEFLPLGIPAIDYGLGGGFARGRFTEIFGDFSSGKTVLILKALAQNQLLGGISIMIPSEGDYDKDFFASQGGDPDRLLIPSPEETGTVEGVFMYIKKLSEDFAPKFLKKGQKIVVGWDGIAGTSTDKLDKDGLDKVDMTKAKMISQGCSMIMNKVRLCLMTILATNQIRDNIGGYGPTSGTPGGHGYKFASSQRIEMRYSDGEVKSRIIVKRKTSGNDDAEYIIGRQLRGRITKNKAASPFGEFWMPFYTEAGLDHPVFDDCLTTFGIDADESLLYLYTMGNFFLDDLGTERVMKLTTEKGGWYALHPKLDPTQKNFQLRDWKKILDQYPQLREIKFDVQHTADCSNSGLVQEAGSGS